ncbi:Ionotropic receptor 138 [Frankliniella occidentalis]|nr:Ionotropic receptor 138 [Frankliniella occidentalis]
MELLAILALLLCPAGYDAVLPDPKASFDTQGVAVLVSSFLSGTTTGVCVIGKSRALDVFLGQLPPETARLHTTSWDHHVTQRLQFELSNNMFLITADNSARLAGNMASTTLPALSRVLLWTWADSLPSAVDVRAFSLVNSMWLYQKQTVLAVSTPDGATSLFNLSCESNRGRFGSGVNLAVAEIDRWLPDVRRWQRQAPPFTRLCSKWRSSDPAPRQVLAFRPGRHVVNPQPYIDFTTAIANSLGVRVEWRDEEPSVFAELRERFLNCSLSLLFSFRTLPMYSRHGVSYEYLSFAPVHVVVPTGMDPHATLLQAVTDEFSTGLWCATVAALLGVTVATALALFAVLDRPLLEALADAPLQTLAPLLAQAPPGRTAHQPLSAVWLLMSVVLVAAYQGLLLRELTTPPGEINTLEQLEDSGLDIRVSKDLLIFNASFLSDTLRSRMTYVSPNDLNLALRMVADGRNTAVILQKDLNSVLLVSSYLTSEPPKLHWFPIGVQYLNAEVAFTTGSPLQELMKRINGWGWQHGLPQRMVDDLANRNRADLHAEHEEENDDALTRPLSLRQLRPAFLLLAYCYSVSAAILVCEIIYHKWFDRRGGGN